MAYFKWLVFLELMTKILLQYELWCLLRGEVKKMETTRCERRFVILLGIFGEQKLTVNQRPSSRFSIFVRLISVARRLFTVQKISTSSLL
jgi:hypothetical protein